MIEPRARDAVRDRLVSAGLGAAEEDHLRVLAWAERQRRPEKTWVLGISGPQGGGKSTLAASLCAGFEALGVRAVAVSIDDFYLTREAQRALAERNAESPYLAVRGYPGTHDVLLGGETLARLTARAAADVTIPRYDKTAFGGLGDRAAEGAFTVTRGPLDVVVLEGWMLGFTPLGIAPRDDPHLAVVDRALAAYDLWWKHLDAMVVEVAPDLDRIVTWRVDAEAVRRRAGQGALDDDEARAYVTRFLPAYRAYVPPLVARARKSAHAMIVSLDADRGFERVALGGGQGSVG